MSDTGVLDRLVASVQRLYGEESAESERWNRISAALQGALLDPELRAAACRWPKSHDRANNRYTNLLFYEDADFGFVINGLVKDATGRTPVHDHGHAWVAYGLLEGTERVLRYQDPTSQGPPVEGRLEPGEQISLATGQVDLVPPWTFHAEQADTDRTVAVMVRSARVASSPTGASTPKPARPTTTPAPTRSPTNSEPGPPQTAGISPSRGGRASRTRTVRRGSAPRCPCPSTTSVAAAIGSMADT